jgi:hypothetical protein
MVTANSHIFQNTIFLYVLRWVILFETFCLQQHHRQTSSIQKQYFKVKNSTVLVCVNNGNFFCEVKELFV